jgi:hypothetical protein
LELQEGDWVRSYTSGIWQIYRILRYIGKDPATGSKQEKTTVFSKRFVLNSLKRSFTEECCHPDFVENLDEEAARELSGFVEGNPALYAKFCEYEPKSIDSIYNARIDVQEGTSTSDIEKILATDRLFNVFEIEHYLQEAGLHTKESPSWTAQFVSANHECEDGYLVYRFSCVLDF